MTAPKLKSNQRDLIKLAVITKIPAVCLTNLAVSYAKVFNRLAFLNFEHPHSHELFYEECFNMRTEPFATLKIIKILIPLLFKLELSEATSLTNITVAGTITTVHKLKTRKYQ